MGGETSILKLKRGWGGFTNDFCVTNHIDKPEGENLKVHNVLRGKGLMGFLQTIRNGTLYLYIVIRMVRMLRDQNASGH